MAVSDVDSTYTSCACDVNLEHLAAAAALYVPQKVTVIANN